MKNYNNDNNMSINDDNMNININPNNIIYNDNNNDSNKKVNSYILDISRIFGLLLLLLTIYVSLTTSNLTLLQLKLNKSFYIKSCSSLGVPTSWKPYNDDNNARLPLYRYT